MSARYAGLTILTRRCPRGSNPVPAKAATKNQPRPVRAKNVRAAIQTVANVVVTTAVGAMIAAVADEIEGAVIGAIGRPALTKPAATNLAVTKRAAISRAVTNPAVTKAGVAMIVGRAADGPRNQRPPKDAPSVNPRCAATSHAVQSRAVLNHAALIHDAAAAIVADVRADRATEIVTHAGRKVSGTKFARQFPTRRGRQKPADIAMMKMTIWMICVRRFARWSAPVSRRSTRAKPRVSCGTTKFPPPPRAASTSLESSMKRSAVRRSSTDMMSWLATNTLRTSILTTS